MSVEELLGDWQKIDFSEEGVAVTDPDGGLASYVRPDHRGRGLGVFLVGWGEEWARERMDLAPDGARVVVQFYVNTADELASRLLESLGLLPEAVRRLEAATV